MKGKYSDKVLINLEKFKKFTDDNLSRSVISQYLGYVIKFIFVIILGGWTARYLGPNSLGKLSMASSVVALTIPFGGLGMRGSLSGILTNSDNKNNLVGSALLVEIFGRGILLLITILFALIYKKNILILLIVFYSLNSFIDFIEILEVDILNNKKGSILGKIGIFESIWYLLLTSIFLAFKSPLLAFGSLAFLRNSFKAILIISSKYSRNIIVILKSASISTCIKLIKRGIPFIMSGLSIVIAMKIDQVMIGWICGIDELGQYSVAVKVNQSLLFLPTILSQTFVPLVAENIKAKDFTDTIRLYKYSWIIGITISLAGIIVFSNLIPIIFGSEFIKARIILIFISPSFFFISMGCAQGVWLNVKKKEKILLKRTIFSCIVNILGNFILLPIWGSIGAGIATTISSFASMIIVTWIDSSKINKLNNLLFPWNLKL